MTILMASVVLRINRILSLGVALQCMALLVPCWASDLAKEQRWADQIIEQLFDGEAVWLTADGIEFLGLYTPAASEPKGSVIVLHGIGVHPDWPQVVNPLRVGLSEAGWSTLSVQLPILENEAEAEEYRPLFEAVPQRVEAATDYLKKRGSPPIFLVAHSMGVLMALHYLGEDSSTGISGLVSIGASVGGRGSLDESASQLVGIRLPVLDIYGENDLDSVLTGTTTRTAVAQASGNDDFTQIEVPGADHFFDGYEPQLLNAVASWLEQRR